MGRPYRRLPFLRNCVAWPPSDVEAWGGLRTLLAIARPIRRECFVRHVDAGDLVRVETDLGYHPRGQSPRGMARDPHVAYFRSRLHGERVYFFRWSGVEYVFGHQPIATEPTE